MIYIIETNRYGEGRWVTKVCSTLEKAENYLREHSDNDELKIILYDID